jgi:Protein of unknwon function (DUF3310)
MEANNKQEGGSHYKKYGDLQPWDVVLAWDLGYLEGTALKYIARWKDKNGLEDIKKAIHFLEKLIEVEKAKQEPHVELTGCTRKWVQMNMFDEAMEHNCD